MYKYFMNLSILTCDKSLINVPINEQMKSIFSDVFFQWNVKHMHDQLVYDKSLYSELVNDKKDIVMVDIGANIGIYSLYFSTICKKLYSVEPAPATYKILNYVTSFFPQIETKKIAISDKNGYVDFYCLSSYNQSSSMFNKDGIKMYVKSKTFSDFIFDLGEDVIDIVKIDVEGAENLFLNQDVIQSFKNKIKQYYIECHDSFEINGKSQKENFQRISKMFLNSGYKIKSYRDERFITLL